MQTETTKKLSPSLAASPGYLLNKAARMLRDNVTEALKPVGLAPAELGILRVVQEEGSPMQSVIADKCFLDRTTVTELLDGLEERKLVVRESSKADRRCKTIRLTPLGRRILVRGARAATRAQQDFFRIVTTDEWETIRHVLVRFIEAASPD